MTNTLRIAAILVCASALAPIAPAQTPKAQTPKAETPKAQAAPAAVPALSDAIKPIRVSGVGLRVSDLERSKKFYTEILGLKVGAKVPATGETHEYLLGLTGDIRADNLIVIRKGDVKPGATEFGSISIVVPNGRQMAERAQAAGYTLHRPLADGTNFVKDPDGYVIELYQRPTPKP